MLRNLLLFALLVCFTITLPAQVDLPYYSGFDNASERAGWQIYRTGENALANWSLATVGGFSPTSCIGHDYAPSTGANVADDWYVSPAFLIPAGGSLDSVRYLFSGFSVPADDDTIGIYLLTGSQNPELATSVTLLADFRGDLYQADGTYRLLNPISLPATQETAYIAIRYLNAQVSSRWLTVRFDNIGISGLTTSVKTPASDLITSVYPNPCTDVLNIEHSSDVAAIELRDYLGRPIQQINIIGGQSKTELQLSNLASGFYYITVREDGQIFSRGFVKR